MKPTIQIPAKLTSKEGVEEVTLTFDRAIVGGWTGRDKDALQHHIDELAKIGVQAPEKTPMFYRVGVSRLTGARAIEVIGDGSSGEVEYTLVKHADQIWVGAASDHTDRVYEHMGITVAKQLCDKPLANEFWPLEEVDAHWDQIRIRATIRENGKDVVYQDGTVGGLLSPRELLKHLGNDGEKLVEGTLLFGGTCGTMGGVRYSDRFTMELIDPVLCRTIRHSYDVHPVPIKG